MFRKLLTIVVYTTIVLIIGRNLIFLPKVTSLYTPTATYTLTHLEDSMQSYIKTKPGHYSIYVSHLTNASSFGINEHTVLTGASINKVPIVAVLYFLANKQKVNLDKKIILQQEDIQDYGTGSMRYQKPGEVYSLKTLAKLTLQQSDNTAAHILANIIGMPTIQATLNSWGMLQTDMANNKTSVTDMALLYQKIYSEQITSQALTKEFLEFMSDTDNETRLPSTLPDTVHVYHKTGDGIGSVHDVGIVSFGNTAYFIGVMTADVNGYEKDTEEAIGYISKLVYDTMKNQD